MFFLPTDAIYNHLNAFYFSGSSFDQEKVFPDVVNFNAVSSDGQLPGSLTNIHWMLDALLSWFKIPVG